jgi:histone acetyltransferase (RNA polymerase elongator complex component)
MNPGASPLIIPIFIPQAGCPHQCVFCNQESITGARQHLPSPSEMEERIQAFLGFRKEKSRVKQLAFYGGNFLGLDPGDLAYLMDIASTLCRKHDIRDLRFSTRPDSVIGAGLEIIKDPLVSTVEIGVQSMDDRVLEASNRGHSALDTVYAVKALKSLSVEIGLQMMVGLPEDTEETALDTAQKIIDLAPDFVRIYPTVVLSKSVLAHRYKTGRYFPLTLDRCVSLVKKIYLLFNRAGIPVIRMGLQPSEELGEAGVILAGPFHPSFGHLVASEIFLDGVRAWIKSSGFANASKLWIQVHPKDLSLAKGLNKNNLRLLEQDAGAGFVSISPDESVQRNWMLVNGTPVQFLASPKARI